MVLRPRRKQRRLVEHVDRPGLSCALRDAALTDLRQLRAWRAGQYCPRCEGRPASQLSRQLMIIASISAPATADCLFLGFCTVFAGDLLMRYLGLGWHVFRADKVSSKGRPPHPRVDGRSMLMCLPASALPVVDIPSRHDCWRKHDDGRLSSQRPPLDVGRRPAAEDISRRSLPEYCQTVEPPQSALEDGPVSPAFSRSLSSLTC